VARKTARGQSRQQEAEKRAKEQSRQRRLARQRKQSSATDASTSPHDTPEASSPSAKAVPKGLQFIEAVEVSGGSSAVEVRPFEREDVGAVSFIGGYEDSRDLPATGLPEVAFLGRSNVGKSSMLNSLQSRASERAEVRISKTPGRTQQINLFRLSDRRKRGLVVLVDLPGYGYTRSISKEDTKKIRSFLLAYLRKRAELRLFLLLVDSRLPAQEVDADVLANLRSMDVPYLVAATKVDRLKASERDANLARLREELQLPSWQPVPFSSMTGENGPLLWRAISDACIGQYEPEADDGNEEPEEEPPQPQEKKTPVPIPQEPVAAEQDTAPSSNEDDSASDGWVSVDEDMPPEEDHPVTQRRRRGGGAGDRPASSARLLEPSSPDGALTDGELRRLIRLNADVLPEGERPSNIDAIDSMRRRDLQGLFSRIAAQIVQSDKQRIEV